jgi:SAM-dependent methyltransferase
VGTESHSHDALRRELEHHERLYDGFAQRHFARPAVVAFRKHLVARLLASTGAGRKTRVLSIGCGIGDTELMLAPHVAEVTGIDLSPKAVAQAERDRGMRGVANARFLAASWQDFSFPGERFGLVLGIFFLHHLSDADLEVLAQRVSSAIEPGGLFYALEPNAQRLSGVIGKLVVPWLMRRYQTPDERQLDPNEAAAPFRRAGFRTATRWHDFASTPVAGVLPGWPLLYRALRVLDDGIVRTPGLRKLSSNFELIARVPA